ncbi:MAG: hypothetical protein RSJ40_02455 [Acetivibrio sp.]
MVGIKIRFLYIVSQNSRIAQYFFYNLVPLTFLNLAIPTYPIFVYDNN